MWKKNHECNIRFNVSFAVRRWEDSLQTFYIVFSSYSVLIVRPHSLNHNFLILGTLEFELNESIEDMAFTLNETKIIIHFSWREKLSFEPSIPERMLTGKLYQLFLGFQTICCYIRYSTIYLCTWCFGFLCIWCCWGCADGKGHFDYALTAAISIIISIDMWK